MSVGEPRTCSRLLRKVAFDNLVSINGWALQPHMLPISGLAYLLTLLFMVSGLGLFYFGSGNHRGTRQARLRLEFLFFFIFCSLSGNICLIMSAKCLSLFSCDFIFVFLSIYAVHECIS